VYTILRFENEAADPPVRPTCREDARFGFKRLPFPVVVAVPVTTTPGAMVAGLLAGQTDM